ncbi:hypothetical protein KC669_04270 [Candidatus Dojkabacteria bacterium]|uniref:Uncharacterized protein n=1 Tax=Candidatus Dojkabacteria bacterium TaxID=2099670 RepID=A0A955RLM6_9BACT|nr:hypothetical protein [Candidatus Dojkabacteria bacterium]
MESESVDTEINYYLGIQADVLFNQFELSRWNINVDDVCEIILAIANFQESYGENLERIINMSSISQALGALPNKDLYKKYFECKKISKLGGLGLQANTFSRELIRHANQVNLIRNK